MLERESMKAHRVRLPSFPVVQQLPVEHRVIRFTYNSEHLDEQLLEEIVVRCLLEAKLADIVQIDAELLCNAQQQ